jgi:hypothetical protein
MLELLKKAVETGELDKVLIAAKARGRSKPGGLRIPSTLSEGFIWEIPAKDAHACLDRCSSRHLPSMGTDGR